MVCVVIEHVRFAVVKRVMANWRQPAVRAPFERAVVNAALRRAFCFKYFTQTPLLTTINSI